MKDSTKEKAIQILDNMDYIANIDMMKKGVYVSEEIEDPQKINTICGGRKACAIGSLWIAAGVRPVTARGQYGGIDLPGAMDQDEREGFVKHRYPLKAAYNALNESAEEYMKENEIHGEKEFHDPVERLFESSSRKLAGNKRRQAMKEVIAKAKVKVETAE